MREFRELSAHLKTAFSLVSWPMRPIILWMMLGSVAVALLDMAAVVLTLPAMQVIGGMGIDSSPALKLVSQLTGVRDQQRMVIVVLAGVLLLMLLKNAGALAFRWWSLGAMARATADASYGMLRLYTTSPWAAHRQRQRADIYQSMTRYVGAAFGVVSDSVLLMVDIVSAIAIMLALLIISPYATLVAVLFFGGVAWALQKVMKKAQHRLGEEARAADVLSWGYLGPVIDGFKEARVADATERFSRDYAQTRRDAAMANRSLGLLGEVPRAVLEVLMILGVLLVGAVLFALVPPQEAFAFLGVFAVGALRMVPALNRAVATLGRIRGSIPNVEALADEVRELRAEDRRSLESSTDHAFAAGDIHFEGLSYRYPDAEDMILTDVSGVIPQGHTVALVGSSGAGKTTFVELLLALLTPTEGTISVSGQSVHGHPHAWWRQLGMVAQDVFVMPRTLRENVAFGFPIDEIDDDRVLRALSLAQLDDVVAAMPEGIYTVLGEQGMRVSGGQKQRIGIARALYRNPQVLVLDEATSALDNETEARITQTIQDLRGHMTIVVVAHRLSTVKNADQILFFSKGRIADRGTMSELVQSCPEFANLVRLGQLD